LPPVANIINIFLALIMLLESYLCMILTELRQW
jgi:hypothetical protein